MKTPKRSGSALVRELVQETNEKPYERIWAGFLTARVLIGLLLLVALVLQLLGGKLGEDLLPTQMRLGLAGVYVVLALVVRFGLKETPVLHRFSWVWMTVVGVDVLAFGLMALLRVDGADFSLLLALPVLEAAVLGSLTLAMGTAALVTIVLLVGTGLGLGVGWFGGEWPQLAISCMGFFLLAFLANHLASRLEREEAASRKILHLADMQGQVNQLILDALPYGVLVVASTGEILQSNPAAQELLGSPALSHLQQLPSSVGQSRLRTLLSASLGDGQAKEEELELALPNGSVQVRVRLQRAQVAEVPLDGLIWAVVFLHDLRQEQARVREEKLLSMGRISAAVAHEIRNPLAAISQANELLEEELQEVVHKRLSKMIRENAVRLGRIVDEILDVARLQGGETTDSKVLDLGPLLRRIGSEWQAQNRVDGRFVVEVDAEAKLHGWCDPDHLRRIVVNLLDNALRYASGQPGAIRLKLQNLDEEWQEISIWSDGPPLEESIQKHLFEPFFSSESRSSGLGLYICRQLSERHGGHMHYRQAQVQGRWGNQFVLYLRANTSLPAVAGFVATQIE